MAHPIGEFEIQARLDQARKDIEAMDDSIDDLEESTRSVGDRFEGGVRRIGGFADAVNETTEFVKSLIEGFKTAEEAFRSSLDPDQLRDYEAQLTRTQEAIGRVRQAFVSGFADEVVGSLAAGGAELERFTRDAEVAGEVVGGLITGTRGLAEVVGGTLTIAVALLGEGVLRTLEALASFSEFVARILPGMDDIEAAAKSAKETLDELADTTRLFGEGGAADVEAGINRMKVAFEGVGDGVRDFTGSAEAAVPVVEKMGTALEGVAAAAEKTDAALELVSGRLESIEALNKTLEGMAEGAGELGKESEDSASGLEDMRKELEELQDLDFISAEQSDRLAELPGLIRRAEASYDFLAETTEEAAAQAEAYGVIQQATNEVIEEARGKVDALAESTMGLDEDAERHLTAVVDNFELLAASGGATGDAVNAFGAQFEATLSRVQRESDENRRSQERMQQSIEDATAAGEAEAEAFEIIDGVMTNVRRKTDEVTEGKEELAAGTKKATEAEQDLAEELDKTFNEERQAAAQAYSDLLLEIKTRTAEYVVELKKIREIEEETLV